MSAGAHNLLLPLFVVIALLAACTPHAGLEPPEDFVESTTENERVKTWLGSEREIRTVRNLMEVEVRHGDERQLVKQSLVFSRPDKMRLEMFGPGLNQLLSLIIVKDGKIEAYDTVQRKLFRGSITRENMAKLTGIPLLPEELVLWLCGKVSREASIKSVRESGDKSSVFVTLNHGGVEIRGLLGSTPSTSLAFYREDKPIVIGRFEDAGVCPNGMKFWLPEHDIEGAIRSSNIELGRPADDRLFVLHLPGDIEIEELD